MHLVINQTFPQYYIQLGTSPAQHLPWVNVYVGKDCFYDLSDPRITGDSEILFKDHRIPLRDVRIFVRLEVKAVDLPEQVEKNLIGNNLKPERWLCREFEVQTLCDTVWPRNAGQFDLPAYVGFEKLKQI